MRRLTLPLVILAIVAVSVPARPAGADGTVVVRARFVASMPDRFGADVDADGMVDLPNSLAYVRPGEGAGCTRGCVPRFTLLLDASASSARRGTVALAVTGYHWEIRGAGMAPIERLEPRPTLSLALPEGTYRVALRVEAALPWGTATAGTSREVVVQDLLVVAIGDSYASGEGNPERARAQGTPALWADAPGDPATEAGHAAAHRSSAAWPALVALALEHADPTTSVTFVSVAASAAAVATGLLGAQPGVSATGQVDQVAALVGARPIDLLLMSVGGNDIGFARILRGLVDADPLADPVCYQTDLANVWAAAEDGDWNRGSGLHFSWTGGVSCQARTLEGEPVLPGLRGLGDALDRLAEAIAGRLHPIATYVMEYPDPTNSAAAGGPCREIVGDITPPFGFHEVDAAEEAEALPRVIGPLNQALADAARRHGWSFVPGVAAAFAAGHGYCSDTPSYQTADGAAVGEAPASGLWRDSTGWYRAPTSAEVAAALTRPGLSWYRTAAQSVALQGPSDAWATMGTMHPNELGQLAMARLLLAALAAH